VPDGGIDIVGLDTLSSFVLIMLFCVNSECFVNWMFCQCINLR